MKYSFLNLDRRIIFLFVFIGIVIPMLLPLHLPIKATPNVHAVYNTIEDLAHQNSGTILISFDYGPSAMPELQPMALAILRHCFFRGVKVVAMNLWVDGVGLAQQALKITSKEYNKVYGKDYVFLGFKTGFHSLVINMGQDFHNAFPKDIQGNRTDSLLVTKTITSLRDFDYVISLAAGNSPDGIWIPFGQEKYKFPFATGCTAVMAPDQFPFLQSGQMNGLIGGLAGAAEYEALVEHPGSATEGMKPQSIVHLIIILLILLGNAIYFLDRGPQTKGDIQ